MDSKLTTKVLLLMLGLFALANVCVATTTVTNLDGNGNKVITVTGSASTIPTSVVYGKVKGIRVTGGAGAKTYQLKDGTGASGNVLWRAYGNGFVNGTTNTIESRVEMTRSRQGMYYLTDDTTATVDIYVGPNS